MCLADASGFLVLVCALLDGEPVFIGRVGGSTSYIHIYSSMV